MYPYWNPIIKPLLIARGARSLVEIGAERGRNTRNLLEYCTEHGAKLQVIEPAPKFDLDSWLKVHEGHFTLDRRRSLEALRSLEPFDTILIDGDHNWYTVYHELKLVEQRSRELSQPMPLVLLHDVGWPYGRRDLYYFPEQIPAAHRHPYARQGMRPDTPELLEQGGLTAGRCNARQENTPRNGVLTAVEDYLRESEQPLKFLKIPGYAGLGILCPAVLEAQVPEVARFMKTWDLPLEVQRFYEQLERSHNLSLIHQMHRTPRTS